VTVKWNPFSSTRMWENNNDEANVYIADQQQKLKNKRWKNEGPSLDHATTVC
jgi:hypothetical protein